MVSTNPPVALTIAGSDNSAGAGLQADLKTFAANGVYGLTAATCIVAEVPGKVTAIQPVDAEIVFEQVRLSLSAFPVGAIKTGMLYSEKIIDAILQALSSASRIPLIIDPVMVATSGDSLLRPEAIARYKEQLFSRATVVTPNLDEVAILLGRSITGTGEMEQAGRQLSAEYQTAFLIKGGHLPGGSARDCLVAGERVTWLDGPYFAGISTHGTGCTYSAAIAAGMARGLYLQEAVQGAKRYISDAIGKSFGWETTAGQKVMALNHFPKSVES